jgi:hypothetical protein
MSLYDHENLPRFIEKRQMEEEEEEEETQYICFLMFLGMCC